MPVPYSSIPCRAVPPRSGRSSAAGTLARLGLTALLLSLCLSLAGCGAGGDTSAGHFLTYTQVQGDSTTKLIEELEYDDALEQTRIRPLPVPGDLLTLEPYVLSLSTGSSAIDLYLLDAPWVKRYSATNWLAPLDVSDNSFGLESFRRELIDVTSIGKPGNRKILAIPFETKGNLLFYRADLLERFNFSPPKTWEELTDQCRVILLELGEEAPRFGFLFHGNQFINDFYPILWGFGGGVLSDDGRLTIDRPENVRALAMIKRTLGTISPNALTMRELRIFEDYGSIDRLFAAGEAVFMINWNTRYTDLERGIDQQTITIDQVGMAPIPSVQGGTSYSNIGSFSWGINLYSDNMEAAQTLIRLINSFEAQRWRAVHYGIVPSRRDVLEDTQLQRLAPGVARMAQVFERVQLRARPFQREINTILDDMLTHALGEDISPLFILQQAQDRIERELAWTQRRQQQEEQ